MDILGLEEEKNEVRLNVNGGDEILDLTRNFFKNISDDVKIALVDLYKYDFSLFDYDSELY